MAEVNPPVRVRYAPSPTGALHLPLRSPPGWAVPAPDRGHRPCPIQAWQPGADRRGPALAGHELGRNATHPVRTQGDLREGGRRLDRQWRRLSLLLHARAAGADAGRAARATRTRAVRPSLPR